MDTAETLTCTLSDGRILEYAMLGDKRSTYNVFYFHGYPSTCHEGLMLDPAARRQQIRLIAPSRPGFGGSTHAPNRTLLSWASDVRALADHLQIQRFAVLGVSGGAPYALACWHNTEVLPRDRLVGAAIVCGLYPPSLGMAGMPLDTQVLFWVAPWATWLVSAGMDWGMGRMARDDEHPEKFEQALKEFVQRRPVEDRVKMEAGDGAVLKIMTKSTREAFRQGGQGPAWDARLCGSRWGFDLDQLEVEMGQMIMWHGAKDANVPVAMAKKAAALIPGVELRVDEKEGHISLLHRADEIMASLVGMLQG